MRRSRDEPNRRWKIRCNAKQGHQAVKSDSTKQSGLKTSIDVLILGMLFFSGDYLSWYMLQQLNVIFRLVVVPIFEGSMLMLFVGALCYVISRALFKTRSSSIVLRLAAFVSGVIGPVVGYGIYLLGG